MNENIPIMLPGAGITDNTPLQGFINSLTSKQGTNSEKQYSPDQFHWPGIPRHHVDVGSQNAAAGQYIVILDKELRSSETAGLGQSASLKAMETEYDSKGAEITHLYDNLNGFVIRPTLEISSQGLIEELRNDPRVAYIEADQRVHAFVQILPTGVDRADGDLSYQFSGDGAGTEADVDIAILDTGVDLTHPDLNVYQARTFVTGTSSAMDDNGHGSVVAGIAAAKDNSIGVVGMAPGARIWAVKVLDKDGSGFISDIIAAIDYLVQHSNEVDVANLSFGCECSSNALDISINNAVAAGITFAAAAGNSNKDASTFFPANNPNVLAVSAIVDTDGKCGAKGQPTSYGIDDSFASFSNYGTTVDIAAPGVEISSTYLNGGFAKMSGTSVAAPHVTGGVALYMALHPDASPAQVRSALMGTSIKPSTVCNGDSYGYFTGDKDNSPEPLLSAKGVGTGGDAVGHKWQNSPGSSIWSSYRSLSGTVRGNSDPAVIANADGRLEVFVVGTDNGLWHRWQTAAGSSTWSQWTSLGGVMKEDTSPAVTRNADGRLEVFVIGTDNVLYHKWQTTPGSSTWSAYSNLGGVLRDNSDPEVIINSDGRLEVFVIGTDNVLYHIWQTTPGSSTWSAYSNLRGGIDSNTSPAVARNTDGRLEVFVIGTDNVLYHKWQGAAGSSTWSQWSSLGNSLRDNGDPAVASNSDGRLEVFVVKV